MRSNSAFKRAAYRQSSILRYLFLALPIVAKQGGLDSLHGRAGECL